MMKFVIGSKTKRKIEIVDKILNQYLKEKYELSSYKANSGVPETPWEKETYDGAHNRAIDCLENMEVDFSIGLESGLIERYGHVFEEAWCCVVTRDKREYLGYSSGLRLPESIIHHMRKNDMQHYEVMQLIEKKYRLSEDDTWGNYSGNLVSRDMSLEEAIRNALIQMIKDEKSFYHKEV